jgi:hypothetical protein
MTYSVFFFFFFFFFFYAYVMSQLQCLCFLNALGFLETVGRTPCMGDQTVASRFIRKTT